MGELWWAAMPLDEDEVDEGLINLAVYNAFRKESLKRYERLFVTAKNISNFIKRKKKCQDLLDIIQADKALLFLDEPKSGPKSRPRPIDDLLESAWNLIEQVKIEIDDIDRFYPEARGKPAPAPGEVAGPLAPRPTKNQIVKNGVSIQEFWKAISGSTKIYPDPFRVELHRIKKAAKIPGFHFNRTIRIDDPQRTIPALKKALSRFIEQ